MGAEEHGQGPARLQEPFFFTQMIAEIKCVEDQEAVALKKCIAVHLLTLNYSCSRIPTTVLPWQQRRGYGSGFLHE